MVRLLQINGAGSFEAAPLAIGLFVSVSAIVALCAKQASRASKKIGAELTENNLKTGQRFSFATPKQLLTTIGRKGTLLLHKKRIGEETRLEAEEEEFFGEGELWQRTILMGDKCQPLDFSGVICYDSNGKQLSQLPPRSPRASPLPA